MGLNLAHYCSLSIRPPMVQTTAVNIPPSAGSLIGEVGGGNPIKLGARAPLVISSLQQKEVANR
jgi:hypothetical protein